MTIAIASPAGTSGAEALQHRRDAPVEDADFLLGDPFGRGQRQAEPRRLASVGNAAIRSAQGCHGASGTSTSVMMPLTP